MAFNRNKVLESARKAISRGQIDKAIKEYEKLVQEDGRDVRSMLKLGDLNVRKGDFPRAVQLYRHVVEHYAQQGFFLKAVAVCKQIMKLEPGNMDALVRLGSLYEQLHLVTDAMSTYSDVVNAYSRAGDADRALLMLHKMVEIDPDHIPVRIRYAEALSRANRSKEAAIEFGRGARLLKDQGRIDDYIKVAERLLFHSPGENAAARELAETYLSINDAKRALSKLQPCFKADPKNPETLRLLADAFRLLGQPEKTISVYKELARVHKEAGRAAERASILRRIVDLAPEDQNAKRALDEALAEKAATPESVTGKAAPPELPSTNGQPASTAAASTEGSGTFLSEPPTGYEHTDIGSIPPQVLSARPSMSAGGLVGMNFDPITYPQFRAMPLASQPATPRPVMPPSVLEVTLEELDALMYRNELEAARGVLSRLQASVPAHPLVRDKENELGDMMRAWSALETAIEAPAPRTDPSPPPQDSDTTVSAEESYAPWAEPDDADAFADDDSFAIAEKLADENTDNVVAAPPKKEASDLIDVDSVFEQFKKGVAEQVEEGDSDTHFDLGIAYKEMGLLADARREFGIARSEPKRETMCWTMIGLCHLEEGNAKDAAQAFEQGLTARDCTVPEAMGLHFELGRTFEMLGRIDSAKRHYSWVYERDPKFRQVGTKLAKLEIGGSGDAGPGEGAQHIFGRGPFEK